MKRVAWKREREKERECRPSIVPRGLRPLFSISVLSHRNRSICGECQQSVAGLLLSLKDCNIGLWAFFLSFAASFYSHLALHPLTKPRYLRVMINVQAQ